MLCAGSALSQNLSLQTYGINEGLVSNDVLALGQDSRGYLWIATAEGVSRYDGRSFEDYRTTEGLASNYITCMTESRAHPGVMWFGAWGEGICRLENGKIGTIRDSTTGLSSIVALLEDTNGDLWCGTAQETIVIRDGNIHRVCADGMDIPGYFLVQPDSNEVWVGSMGNIHIIAIRDLSVRTIDLKQLGIGAPDCMLAETDGTVWLGTEDSLLVEFRHDKPVSQRNLGSGGFKQIVDDGTGNLWICSRNGLLRTPKRGGPVSLYSTINGLANDVVGAGLVDHEGTFWFSCAGNGISKLSTRGILSFQIPEFPNTVQLSVLSLAATDAAGHLWVCSGDGLWEFWKREDGEWQKHLHMSAAKYHDIPTSVQTDQSARLWMWTVEGNTVGYEVRTGHPSDLRLIGKGRKGIDYGPEIDGLRFIDSQTRFWFLVRGAGVAVYDQNFDLLRRFTTEDGLPSTDIRAISEDQNGDIWCGGVVGGISVIPGAQLDDPGVKMKRLGEADGLADECIRSMAADRNGRILIGTRYGGLHAYADERFHHISIDEGLISNGVYSIADNTDETWWVGTGSGLQGVDAREMKPMKPVKDLVGQIIYVCGLVPNNYAWSLGGGPVTYRLTLHELASATENRVPPPVYITELFVNSRPYDILSEIELPYDQNALTLGFVGLSFKDERETRFQHRLLGGTGEWSPPAAERSVTYAGLAPGDYVFEVQAFNNDGVASTESALLSFSISPPFWRTWWFFLSIAMIVAGMLWGFYRYRVSGILALERMRFRIARDLHDDVGGTLSGITHLAEAAAAEEGTGTTQRLLRRIAESSTTVQASLDDIVWSLNPTPDTWEVLLAKCRRYASDLCEAKGMHHSIEMQGSPNHASLSPVVKENFWLMFKEMITNSVKHSGATTLVVRLSFEDSMLKLLVEDNGRGFDSSAHTTRNGLRNLHMRAHALGATANLITTPGNGTCWSVFFRIRR